MFNVEEEFAKYNKRVLEEEKKYANTEVNIKNYKIPHIYLTDEEIEEFNSLCDKINYDLKVVAIDDYMNLNSPEKNSDENQDEEEDEESIDTKMERVSKAMDYLGNNFLPNIQNRINNKNSKKKFTMEKDGEYIMNEVNDFIGKKQQRNFFVQNNINIQKNNNENDTSVLSEGRKSTRKKKKKNENELDNDYVMKSNSEKKISKKKNCKNDNNIIDNMQDYFKKIKETRQEQIYDEKRKNPLINEIIEKSQLLTPNELQEFAKQKHIRIINETNLSEYDLQKRDVRELDRILVDINFNSNVSQLKNENRENIKKMKKRQNLENKSILAYMQHKKMKEEKKLENTQNIQKEKSNNLNSDIDSCSDDESI